MVLWCGSLSKLIQYPSLLWYKLLPCKPRCTDTTAHAGTSVSGHRHCRGCFLVPPQHCCEMLARELVHFVTKTQVPVIFLHENFLFPAIIMIAKSRSRVCDFNYIFREASTVSKRKPTLGKSNQLGKGRIVAIRGPPPWKADASLFCLVTVTSKPKKLCNKAGRVLRSPE